MSPLVDMHNALAPLYVRLRYATVLDGNCIVAAPSCLIAMQKPARSIVLQAFVALTSPEISHKFDDGQAQKETLFAAS